MRKFLSPESMHLNLEEIGIDNNMDPLAKSIFAITDIMKDSLFSIPALDKGILQKLKRSTQSVSSNSFNTSSKLDASFSPTSGLSTSSIRHSEELTPIAQAICDLVLEVFNLHSGNNWVRGRAIVLLVQQLLGGTTERIVRENVSRFLEDEMLARGIGILSDMFWPGGGALTTNAIPRTEKEKLKTKLKASVLLMSVFTDFSGSVLGQANANIGARRVFATFQNSKLNSHLLYTLFDELVCQLFPEIEVHDLMK